MYHKVILILLLLIVIYNQQAPKEGIQFYADYMNDVYKKHGITIDRKRKTLTKGGKTISYKRGFNEPHAKKIARNKLWSKMIFEENGIPTPKYYHWNNSHSFDANMRNIDKLTFPIVIKPNDLEQGINVFSNIKTLTEAEAAIRKLQNNRPAVNSILIEEMINGDPHRIFIFDDDIIAVYRISKPRIVGDGKHSVTHLINKLVKGADTPIGLDQIDKKYIREQGFGMNDVPLNERVIIISHVSNGSLRYGTKPIDVKDIHPANIEMFKKISNVFGLRANGIDYITYDLAIPYYKYGSVLEVNGDPGVHAIQKTNPAALDKLISQIKFN